MVFGHPAHELALFGAIQRLRPLILILTDGGSPERETFSERGLSCLGLTDQARYLHYKEKDFYEALLNNNTRYFDGVINDLRDVILAQQPDQIFCDAIEFYNPVHDIIYVLVRAAMQGVSDAEIFRVPLVYQDVDSRDYTIQRVPESLAKQRLILELNEAETSAKCRARDEIYLNLRDSDGGDFMGLPPAHAAREEVEIDDPDRLAPGDDGRVLRYEWRAELLREQGLIDSVITFHRHFEPLVAHYLGAPPSMA